MFISMKKMINKRILPRKWLLDILKHTLKINITKCPKATTGGVLSKSVFLKISQKSQENTCAGVSFLLKKKTLLKKRL